MQINKKKSNKGVAHIKKKRHGQYINVCQYYNQKA
jgi:hypothetical protein